MLDSIFGIAAAVPKSGNMNYVVVIYIIDYSILLTYHHTSIRLCTIRQSLIQRPHIRIYQQ